MKLRRICKYNYAAYSLPITQERVLYLLFLLLYFINYVNNYLDIFKLNGIIHLTYIAVVKEVVMAQKPKNDDSKEKAPRDCGALNTHPVRLATHQTFPQPTTLVAWPLAVIVTASAGREPATVNDG